MLTCVCTLVHGTKGTYADLCVHACAWDLQGTCWLRR